MTPATPSARIRIKLSGGTHFWNKPNQLGETFEEKGGIRSVEKNMRQNRHR